MSHENINGNVGISEGGAVIAGLEQRFNDFIAHEKCRYPQCLEKEIERRAKMA